MMHGRVDLVGAGPGAADLITLRGLRLLRRAEVVLYDRLVPHDLLTRCQPSAILIDVGKRQHDHPVPQDQIERLMVHHARLGRRVVRLKGGDPGVLGRGGEELEACRAAGVKCRVTPGVTSPLAAAAAAGLALTHREFVKGFTVYSAHELFTPLEAQALAALAEHATLALLMGSTYLCENVARLLTAGLRETLPAVGVRAIGSREEDMLFATAGDLPARVAAAGFGLPAVFLFGEAVKLGRPRRRQRQRMQPVEAGR